MFYIYDNNFSGTLPNELQTLKLFALQAQGNMFTGAIPEGLYFNNALKQLRLDDNVFTGTISGRAGDLVDLEDLRLNGNELTGTIPATLSRLSQLRTFNICRGATRRHVSWICLTFLFALAFVFSFRIPSCPRQHARGDNPRCF